MHLDSAVDIINALWARRPVNRDSIAGSRNRRFSSPLRSDWM